MCCNAVIVFLGVDFICIIAKQIACFVVFKKMLWENLYCIYFRSLC